MFIRKDIKKIRNKVYRHCRLVETYRSPKGIRQRTVLSLGRLNLPKKKWDELVELIEDALYGQKPLFAVDPRLLPIAERVARKIKRKGKAKGFKAAAAEAVTVKPSAVKLSDAKELGTVYVGYAILKRLAMDKIFRECGLTAKYTDIGSAMIVARLVHPDSELATVSWLKRTALGELLNKDFDNLNEDILYRVSDALLKRKEMIEAALRNQECGLFGLKEQIVLYDLTSTYFEGLLNKSQKAQRGYSRDGRAECKQVVVGLILDEDGFAKGHELYRGNKSDSEGIKEFLARLGAKLATEEKPTVVVDRGIATKGNLEAITTEGYKYIVAARGNERAEWLKEFQFEEEDCQLLITGKSEVRISMRRDGQETYLLCQSEGRAKKETAIWQRAKEALESDLSKLQRRIAEGRLKEVEKMNQAIGRLKERHPRVARFYELGLTGSSEAGWNLLWQLDEAKAAEREILNGTYLLRTNRDDLTAEQIWRLYTMLTKVEWAFRCLKSELGLRPNWHQKDPRIEGHIFISMLAYHLLHTIEWTLRGQDDHKSWGTLRELLTTHQVVTVTLPDEAGKVHHLRLMTEPDDEQREIYRKLKLNERPLRYKHLVVG